MEILLAFLVLIFGISDLIGQEKANYFECRLLHLSSKHFYAFINFARFIKPLSVLSMLLFITLIVSLPYFAAIVLVFKDNITVPGGFEIHLNSIWRLVFFLVLSIVGATCAFIALAILQSFLPASSRSLKGQPERYLVVRARRILHKAMLDYERMERKERRSKRRINIYGSNFPVYIGPLVAILFFPLVIISLVARLFLSSLYGCIWILWGSPIVGLKRLSNALGNPSYFNIAKYLLLAVMFVWLIVKRICVGR
ncbi:hypothetical protein ES703_38887 [subsurface metagenome]